MKVLLDEDVPGKLARFLSGHEIHTVVGMQWGGVKNGALLELIERERSNVPLTGDKNLDKQQRLDGRPIAVLVMSAINWPVIRSHISEIAAAIDEAQPGTIRFIDCGLFIAHAKRPRE